MIQWSAGTVETGHECSLFVCLPSCIVITLLMFWLHHIKLSSIHFRAGRPGCLSPSTTPNVSVFSSRSSGIAAFYRCGCRTVRAFSLGRCFSVSTLVVFVFSLHRLLHVPAIRLPVQAYVCSTASRASTACAGHLSWWSAFPLHSSTSKT